MVLVLSYDFFYKTVTEAKIFYLKNSTTCFFLLYYFYSFNLFKIKIQTIFHEYLFKTLISTMILGHCFIQTSLLYLQKEHY